MDDRLGRRAPCTSTTLATIKAGLRTVHDLNQREIDALIAALKRARAQKKLGK